MSELLSDLGAMDEAQLCELCKIEPRTAKNWRTNGEGPPWVKVGNSILYLRRSVARWLQDREATNGLKHPQPKGGRNAVGSATHDDQ